MPIFSIDISHNIKAVQKQLNKIQRKQIPFAAAKALTDTAKDAQKALKKQIPLKLNNPTRFTQNSIGIVFAKKSNLQSAVFVKPRQAEYLRWQIEGGTRRTPGAGTGVPTKNRKLNQFGNIPGRKKGLVKGKKQFIATIRGVAGVWQRFGGKRNPKVKLVIAFEKEVSYSKRFPFYKIAKGVVRSRFARNFDRSIRLALLTSK